jgi:hypothetical protein
MPFILVATRCYPPIDLPEPMVWFIVISLVISGLWANFKIVRKN